MADENIAERPRKKARVDKASRFLSTVCNETGSVLSDRGNRFEEKSRGPNFSECVAVDDYFHSKDDGNEHSYSITYRWRKRVDMWEQWLETNPLVDKLQLCSLKVPTSELFLKTDDDSELGKQLVVFAADVEKCKDVVRRLEEESETLASEMATLEGEKHSFEIEIAALKRETASLAGEIASLKTEKIELESSQSSATGGLLGLLLDDKSKLMDDKSKLIDKNSKIIDKNSKIIDDKWKLIDKNSKQIDKNRKIISLEIQGIRTKTKDIHQLIEDISKAHRAIRNKFAHAKSKGNESLTTNKSQLQSLDKCRFDMDKASSPAEFDEFSPKHNGDFRDSLTQQVLEAESSTLCSFQTFVRDLFHCATETDANDFVKNTTDALLHWEPGEAVDRHQRYARPPTNEDREGNVDQPILHAVICRIIRILVDSSESIGILHPHEYGVTSERTVAGSHEHNTKSRRIDFTAQQREEHLPVLLPTMVQKALEIKPARDEIGNFMKALEKGRSQIVGHLGKRLMYYFDFGGTGIDSHALGMCLTPLSIEVIKMSLSGVGTKHVELGVISTGCVPLLGEKVLKPAQKEAFASMETNGFVLLAGALKHDIQQGFVPPSISSFTQVIPKQEELPGIDYLGSGAFSNVVKLRQDEFMKIPKSACLVPSLMQEAAILQKLQIKTECSSIPKLVVHSKEGVSVIQTVIRGEISEVVGLRLSGVVGIPLHSLSPDSWVAHAISIISTVYEALRYAHSKQIYHLDVRPGNIIVQCTGQENQCRAMLSDWGCSVDGTDPQTKLKSFRGCTPYAHDRLLGKLFKGTLGSELDFASLAYTFDHVKHRQLRWTFHFDRPSNVTTSDLELRRQCVRDWLGSESLEENGQTLPPDVLEAMKSACCFRRSRRARKNRSGTYRD